MAENPEKHSRPTKAEVRAEVLAARRLLPVGVRQEADARIRAAVAALVSRLTDPVVACYLPLRDEPGGPPGDLLAALPATRAILLPVLLADRDLDWARYGGTLESGLRGTVEPAGQRLGVTAIGTADLVIVPALAVRPDGVRLGRGGGSYDRALARVRPGTPTVALLYAGEVRADLPAQPHDRAVDGYISPAGTHWLRPVPVAAQDP